METDFEAWCNRLLDAKVEVRLELLMPFGSLCTGDSDHELM